MIKKILVILIIFIVISFSLFLKIIQNITPELNKLAFEFFHNPKEPLLKSFNINIAVIGDTHTKDNQKSYDQLNSVLNEVKNSKPDLVLFVGDYTDHPRKVSNMSSHQKKIINILTQELNTPTIFVLGNYETWTDHMSWYSKLSVKNNIVLQNEVILIEN